MKTEDRKLAIADYKKRASIAGVFAIRCAATGAVWVGQALDLDKIQSRIGGLWVVEPRGDDGCGEGRRAKAERKRGQQGFDHRFPRKTACSRVAESSIPEGT